MSNHSDDRAPQIIQNKILSLQLCVPIEWTDQQAIDFAEQQSPCGTSAGWQIARKAYPAERVRCRDRDGFIHIVVLA